MKKCFRFSFLLVFYLISLPSFLQSQTFTNCFYDNHKTEKLKTNPIFVDGEIENSSFFNPEGLKLHSVIVKESSFDQDLNINFIGAYRYDGYSLKEILDPYVLKKKNANEFPPEVDLFVEVSNDEGDKVILSWGEIFYPNKINQIIVAVQVMPIIPEKTKDQ